MDITTEVGYLVIEALTIKDTQHAVPMIAINDATGHLDHLTIKDCIIDGEAAAR